MANAIHARCGLHRRRTPIRRTREDRKLFLLQADLANARLLIIDEHDYFPLSQIGSECLFEVLIQCYERGATKVTSNLPSQEWTLISSSERPIGVIPDRIAHHVHIKEVVGKFYRLKQSRS